MTKNKCLRCGYEWNSEKEKFKCCPVCRNYRWNETKRDVNRNKKFQRNPLKKTKANNQISASANEGILEIIIKGKTLPTSVEKLSSEVISVIKENL